MWRKNIILITSNFHSKVIQFSSVQLLSHVRLFVTPWTTAYQASLSLTISRSLLKVMSIESVMPSNHLSLCHPLLLLTSIFPSIRVFSKKLAICIKWPSIGASASASILPKSIQSWFSLGFTGLISLLSVYMKYNWLHLLSVWNCGES